MCIIQDMANRYPLHQPQMQPHVDVSVSSMYPKPRAGMWPHHPHQQSVEEQVEKHREYLKQQQKLRLMTATTTPQAVSADALIENLLGKKETFKPKSSHGLTPGALPASQHTVGNVGIPVPAPAIVSSHIGTTVRPVIGYPMPPTAAIPPGSSSTTGVTGSYSTSILSPEAKGSYAQIPVAASNKGFVVMAQANPQIDVNASSQAQFPMNLPPWLSPSSSHLPQFYRQVWKMVGQDKGLVDTKRIFPLLLTSGLPTDVLGFIWGLANRKIAGQLTEQELYIVLALVALAQSGCTFNSLSVLNLIPQPPIPNLKLVGFESVSSIGSKDIIDVTSASNQGKMKREQLNLSQLHSSTSAPLSGDDDAGFDEFTEFQSATLLTTESSTFESNKESVPTSKPEVQNSTLTATSSGAFMELPSMQKCPSVMVVSSSGHGRGIGSRLANHSLGTPKQKKTKHHHHHHHHRVQSQMTSIPSSMDEDFSEFQQAKDLVTSATKSADGNVDDEVFPKCMVKAASIGKTYLLKESAIRTDIKAEVKQQITEPVKDNNGVISFESTQSGTDIIERDKLNLSPERLQSSGDKHDLVGGKQMTIGLKVSPSLSSTKKSKNEGVNLMSVEEDKYSALRNLSLGDKETSPDKTQLFLGAQESPASDEFGDFLSAEPQQTVDDSFADIATREQVPKNLLDVNSIWKTQESPESVEFQIDDWGEYKGAPVSSIDFFSEQSRNIPSEIKLDSIGDEIKTNTDISSTFMALDLKNENTNRWDQKPALLALAGHEEVKPSVLPGLEESAADLNLGSSWNFNSKEGGESHSDKNSNVSAPTEQRDAFHGFLGRIYKSDDFGDIKTDNYSTKVDMFCSSPDDLHENRTDNFNVHIQTHDDDDDFGEFIGPDTWSEEQKYNASAKDNLFDGHLGSGLKDTLYGDSQSVSSLELPPLALSRHGSVPSLNLKIFPSTEKNGGSGGNQPWDMSPQGIDHQLSEWQRCLQSCLTMLQSAVEIFSKISCEDVIEEVVGSAEGKDYLQNLLEVAGVSHRVECSYKQLGNSGEYKQLDSLLADINGAWSTLEAYYIKADICVNLELDQPIDSEDRNAVGNEPSICCGVCLTDINNGTKIDNRNTSQLEYGGHVYHSVCANLWVNCVDSSLPALATGINSFL